MHYLQKELFELLQKDKGVFQFIQNSSLDGLWYWDLEQPENEWMDERFWQTLGYDPSEKAHKASEWQTIIFEEDLALAKENLEKHLADPAHPYDQTVRYKHSNGAVVWVRCRGLAIRDEAGKPVRMLGAHNDVTELKASEQHYKFIAENTSDGILVLEQDTVVYASPNYTKILGYGEEEEKQRNIPEIFALIHPDDRERIQEFVYGCMAQQLPSFNYRYRAKHKKGHYIWREDRTNVIYDRYGLPFRSVLLAREVSREMQMEEELVRTKMFLEETTEISGVGGWEVNLAENTVYWSEETKRIHEVPPNFVPSLQKGIDFYKAGHSRKCIAKAVQEGINSGTPWNVELQIVTYTGKEKWVKAIGKPVFKNGKCIKLKGTFQDIDKQKKEDELIKQQNSLLDSINKIQNDFLAKEDAKDIFNSLMDTLLSLTESEFGFLGEVLEENGEPYLKAHTITNIAWDENSRKLYNHWKDKGLEFRNLDTLFGEVIRTGEVLMTNDPANHPKSGGTPHGHPPLKSFLGIPCHVKGRFVGMVGIANSPSGYNEELLANLRPLLVTIGQTIDSYRLDQENKRMMAALQQAKEDAEKAKEAAERANAAKSDFLANMSHEIRTPLNSVIGFTELLLRTELQETQRQYLSSVHTSGKSLLDLINDILDFSKIEAGKLELSTEKADLWDLVSDVAEMVKHKANEKELEITLHIPSDIPRYVTADVLRIKQVLINLLSNAIKFTKSQGEIRMSIGVVQQKIVGKPNHKLIRFSVADTGIGIAPEQQQKIFEAFAQADVSTTRKYGGTGLGLSISNSLLKLMGGKLLLESEIGKGSNFFFDLELPTEKGSKQEWEGLEDIKKVLIVDDNRNNCMILTDMLQLANIPSETARSAMEALKKLQQQPDAFDLMITDYQMPLIDGMELIEKVRERMGLSPDELRIVLLHSLSDASLLAEQAKRFNVQANLNKPITIKQLFGALSQLKKAPAPQPLQAQEQQGLQQGKADILLVDDNELNLLLAKNMLTSLMPNASIAEARDGQQAIEQYKTKQFDIIFMDVQMPTLSGYEATKAIRKLEQGKSKRIPIVALTAGTIKGEKERCMSSGMDDYLSKPISLKAFGHILSKWWQPLAALPQQKPEPEGETSPAHFDRKRLVEQLNGNEQAFAEIITLIRGGLIVEQVQALTEAVSQKDEQEVRAWAHKLNGSGSSACLDRLSGLAQELEQLTPFCWDKAQALLQQLAKEAAHITQMLNRPAQPNK